MGEKEREACEHKSDLLFESRKSQALHVVVVANARVWKLFFVNQSGW